jgi:hypothetical protein
LFIARASHFIFIVTEGARCFELTIYRNWSFAIPKIIQGRASEFYLKANLLIAQWFPYINADIFISHSHKDYNDVVCLAGWLEEKFGLTAFVDSSVWGYSDRLLKLIDGE